MSQMKPEDYWISRGKDLIGLDVLELKGKARQASTYMAIALEVQRFNEILDVGCNVGALNDFILNGPHLDPPKYFGIDSNSAAVAYCQDRDLNVMRGNIRELGTQEMECIVVKDVLEHLESLEPARNVFRVASWAVILSFFIPPLPSPEIIEQTEAGYFHNRYNECDLLLLADECRFGLVKRIDTWETSGALNRTYIFERH